MRYKVKHLIQGWLILSTASDGQTWLCVLIVRVSFDRTARLDQQFLLHHFIASSWRWEIIIITHAWTILGLLRRRPRSFINLKRALPCSDVVFGFENLISIKQRFVWVDLFEVRREHAQVNQNWLVASFGRLSAVCEFLQSTVNMFLKLVLTFL